jgi:SAM-dependent methyltransferase
MPPSTDPQADGRLGREREFHDARYAGSARAQIDSFYELFTAGAKHYEDYVLSACAGRRALEYGCGEGRFTVRLAAAGATVHAIDISEVALETARQRAAAQGLNADFRLMDAGKLQFENDAFDLICGRSILHHLDLETALSEVARTLRPDGRAIFLEPLGDNPALRLARRFTPELRSADERPLRRRDIRSAARGFGRVEARYFHLASLLAVPFRRMTGVETAVAALESFDALLFQTPLRHLAWVVVLVLAQPRKA